MKITFSSLDAIAAPVLAVAVMDDRELTAPAKALDEATNGALSHAVKQPRFTGKVGDFTLVATPSHKTHQFVALFGVGAPKELKAKDWRKIGASLQKNLDAHGFEHAAAIINPPQNAAQTAVEVAAGTALKAYRFDKYFTQLKPEQKPALTKFTIALDDHKEAKKAFAEVEAVLSGVTFTRNLVSEPANVIYPETLAEKALELKDLGVKVEVLGEKEMHKLGMGALLGVGQGSEHESQLVVMQWNGGKKDAAPLAIVGKGVTFDTGGISIKPAGGMEEMKWDMGGAGVTIGLMKALAERKAKANVVGVIGLVENMPSGTAQRPGDVVTSMSGQTIEVINTDAEGRLVLADALWYTQDRFNPSAMVTLATLTGAIIVSLGKQRAGLFANDDALATGIFAAGEETGERVWRMPVGDEYAAHIKSDIADMKNVGRPAQAGSISAAEFLSRFVNDKPWAHLDIAGVTWTNEDLDLSRKGATGFGVRLLNQWIAEHYEK